MNFSEKKVSELKAKHGELFLIEVDGKSCILRKPKRQDLSFVSAVKDPIKMEEALLNQLWVDGDPEIKTDDSLFLAVANKMDEVIKTKEATVKKL